MSNIVVIAHNMRSTHNIGSLFRTADGFGVQCIGLSGYTAYPMMAEDPRLPHIARKLDAQIHKTALGAEQTVKWKKFDDLESAINHFRKAGYTIVALEQDKNSTAINKYGVDRNAKIALVLGTERDGLSKEELVLCDDIVEIPMHGLKESFNVVQAAAIALYALSNND